MSGDGSPGLGASGDAQASGGPPPVSVIMAVRDQEPRLAEAVRRVLAQDYPAGLEVVLAVGPSRDRTRQVAEQLAAADSRITVVANPAGTIPAALNLAVRAARHPVIARVDGRSLLPPGYLRSAVRTLGETSAVNVGGVMAAAGVTPFQQAVAWAMTSPAGVGSARFHTGGEPGPSDSVYLGTYRRDAIERAGGYDEGYLRAEDWELNLRIRRAGGLIWFDPGLRVAYRPRENLRSLAHQYFMYGRWRRVVARRHPGTINARYLAPPAVALAVAVGGLAGLAGLAAVAAGGGGSWLALLAAGFAVPALYLAGIAAVTGTAARQVGWRAMARLPGVLVTMHLCWGAGFLTSPATPGAPGRGRAADRELTRAAAQPDRAGSASEAAAPPAAR